MNETLIEFEQRVGLGPTFAARLLCVAYPTYAHYRSGHRELPAYHVGHIDTMSRLSVKALNQLIEERAHGRSK